MPSAGHQPASIRVLTETESEHGWLFVVSVPRPDGPPAEHELTLAWVDYEHWSHGAHSPSRVAESVVRAVLDAQPERDLPQRFDASTSRRWIKGLDEKVRDLL